MSYYRNQYESSQDYTYQSIPSKLTNPQQPRTGPINELNFISTRTNFNTQGNRATNSPPKRPGLLKLNDFRNRISEVIDLCKRQNTDVKGQFEQVVTEEKQIYNMLMGNPSLLQKSLQYQNVPRANQNFGQTIPFNRIQTFQRPQQLTTPYQTQRPHHSSQSHYFKPQISQVGLKQVINQPPLATHYKFAKPNENLQQQYTEYLNQPFITFGSNQQSTQNLQTSINKLKNVKQANLNEESLKIIEQIQRKAFEQIEKLRRQKLELMQKLNQQIKNVNEQRRKNAQLSALLNNNTAPLQNPNGFYASGENIQQLQLQIQRLQSELFRVNQLNNHLRMQLNKRGSGIPGIQQLLRQGEAIRQQTLRLLKLKEQGESGKVQELERKLTNEQLQKASLINELKSLKEQLRQEGRSINTMGAKQFQAYQRSDKVVSPQNAKSSVGQYEDLVTEMKRLTGY